MKILLAISALVAFSASGVSALVPKDPCTWGWTGIQTNFDCTADQWNSWIKENNNLGLIAPTAIVFLIGLFTFVSIIFALCFRYCCQCCGSSRLRPGHGCCGGSSLDELSEESKLRLYTPSEVWWNKTLTLFILMLAIVGCALAVQGSVQSSDIADVISAGSPSFVNWVNSKIDAVEADINTTNPNFRSAVDKITSVQNDMGKFLNETKPITDHAETVKKAFLGLAGPSALVVIAAFGAVVCAFCSIRSCLPLFFIFITMLAALITGTLGFGAGALSFGETVWCDEVDAFRRNESGVFNWYIVPSLCEQKIDFPALKKSIDESIASLANEGCTQLANACDNLPAYVVANPTKLYYCPTAPSNCNTTKNLIDAMKSLTVKTGVPSETTCGGTCNVEQCAANCTNTELKSKSAEVVSAGNQANNASNAIETILKPVLSCSVVTEQLLTNFDVCGSVKSGVTRLFAGCFVATIASVFLAFALFCGQKRFIASSALDKSRGSTLDSARNNREFETRYGGVDEHSSY